MQIQNFSKFGLKLLKIFLKKSLHILVDDGKHINLICELFFYCLFNNGEVFFVCVTNEQTYRSTLFLTLLVILFQWYITLCGCLNKHQLSAKQYVSTVNCET